MNRRIAALLASLVFFAASAFAGTSIPRWFNVSAFVGLAAMPTQVSDTATLDYDDFEDRSGGTIRLTTCRQVEATDSDLIRESQHHLFRLLAANCAAADRFTRSKPARGSHFPRQVKPQTVKNFPAMALPVFSSSEDLQPREGKTLQSFLKIDASSLNADRSVRIETEADFFTYRVMGRADFDDDGIEDLLVRVDWSAKGGRGRLFDLFVIARKTAHGPMAVVWRLGTLNTGR